MYKLVKNGIIGAKKLRRKGKNNPKNDKERRGRINDCKIIITQISSILKLPLIKNTGILKGIPLSVRIVNQLLSTLVEKKSKYIVLLKVSRKSQDVKDEIIKLAK